MLADEGVTTGDTVTVPIGSCTWASTLTVSKSITLQGAGSGSTIITFTSAADPGINSTQDNTVIKGFDFKAPGDTNSYILKISGDDWLVCYNIFESTVPGDKLFGVFPSGPSGNPGPTGVIFYNTFNDTQVVCYGSAQMLNAGDDQHVLWAAALAIGGEDAVYIEGNTFNMTANGNVVDGNYGAAYVVRHNTFNVTGTGYTIEAHSLLDSTKRAIKTWEIYNNLIVGSNKFAPMLIRGGTGVIFNNRLSGTFFGDDDIHFDNSRSYGDPGGACGQCDGDSVWDGNTAEQSGYPCRDQLGRGPDGEQWSVDTTDGDPYGAYNQTLTPAYVWDNLKADGSTPMSVYVTNDCGNWIQVNRDYYLSAKPSYVPRSSPDARTGLSGVSSSVIAGAGGYNLSSGITGMGSGGSATMGGSGTITLVAP